MSDNAESLWEWSIEHYGFPGAEGVLIEAQDKFSLNVNILLWCCWHGEYGRALSELEIRNALDISVNWSDNITSALRHARRNIKEQQVRYGAAVENQNALYEAIKKTELMAEKHELSLYEAIGGVYHSDEVLPQKPAKKENVLSISRRNIATYLALAKVSKTEDFSVSLIERIIDKVLPQG